MSEWFFEKRDPDGVHSAPKHDEHFADVRGIVASLTRETSQNSGDAGTGQGPVKMSFRFGKVERSRFEPFVEGLMPHLEAFPSLASNLQGTAQVPYLAIEDFETHGLRGSYDPKQGAESDYVAFWHRYGESGKSQEKGGRHGLGKSTIASASRLRMFFGTTVRLDCERRHLLLQGQIQLKAHSIGDVFYDAYGLWYDRGPDRKRIPLIDKAAAGFTHLFDLQRGKLPGLSLVIPFPDEDINKTSLVKAIIENSFHQIVSGELIVHVDDVFVSPKTIRTLAEEHGLGALRSAIDLSAEVANQAPKSFSPRTDAPKARLTPEHFTAETLNEMRAVWAGGQTVSVRLPVSIRKKDEKTEQGEVFLYARREQNADLAKETYVRGRVSVPIRALTDRTSYVGLLVADKGVASTFLGDSEPPAHDRWLVGRLRRIYWKPEDAFNRIKYGLRDLLHILDTGADDTPIKDAFTEWLWTPQRDDNDDEDDTRRRKKRPKNDPVPPPIAPIVVPHQLRRIDGGFSYAYRPEDETVAPGAKILVGYRRRVKPKKSKRAPKFFDFGDGIEMEESGSADLMQETEARRILFQIKEINPGYELRVTGFDPNRDLELRLETVME